MPTLGLEALFDDDPTLALDLLVHEPDTWDSLHNRALCLEMLERYDEAEKQYLEAASASSVPRQKAQSLVGAANTWRHRKDDERSLDLLQQALHHDAKWPQAHFLLSGSRVRQNDLEAAAKALFNGYAASMDTDAVDTDSFLSAYIAVPPTRAEQPRTYRKGAASLLDLLYAEFDRPAHVKLLHQLVTAGTARADFLGATEPGWCFVSEHFHTGSVVSNFLPLLRYLVQETTVQVVLWAVGAPVNDAALDELKKLARVTRTRPAPTDVTICLDGHTGTGEALRRLSARLSPVQIDYLGYPFTSGSAAIDAKFADAVTDPPGQEDLYTERLVRLPCCMWVWEPDASWVSNELPAPSSGKVLVCQNFKKLRPSFLRACGAILDRNDRATIHFRCTLLADTGKLFRDWILPHLPAHVRSRAELVGNPDREDIPSDLATYHVALDTWPYNGTVTSMECLYAGLPVVTYAQHYHRGRTTCSILTACSLQDLITHDEEAYVQKASEVLARPPEAMHQQVRQAFADSDIMHPEVLGRAFHAAIRNLSQ